MEGITTQGGRSGRRIEQGRWHGLVEESCRGGLRYGRDNVRIIFRLQVHQGLGYEGVVDGEYRCFRGKLLGIFCMSLHMG